MRNKRYRNAWITGSSWFEYFVESVADLFNPIIPAFSAEHCPDRTLRTIAHQAIPTWLSLGTVVAINASNDPAAMLDEFRLPWLSKQGYRVTARGLVSTVRWRAQQTHAILVGCVIISCAPPGRYREA